MKDIIRALASRNIEESIASFGLHLFASFRKAEACERESLEISCQAGEHIHVVKAMYGRSNNLICPTDTWDDQAALCSSSSSLMVVSDRYICSNIYCEHMVPGAMIERGVLLQPQIQSLGIRALALASTLKSCTPASPTLRRNLTLKWTNQTSTYA